MKYILKTLAYEVQREWCMKPALFLIILASFMLFSTPQDMSQQVIATIDLEGIPAPENVALPQEIALDPLNNRIYATVSYRGRPFEPGVVAVIDGGSNTVITTIPVGRGPWGIAYNPITHKLYVANQNGGGLSVIDADNNTVVKTINSQLRANTVAVNSSTNRIYVSQENSTNLWVIDGATDVQIAKIDIRGYRPGLVVVNPITNRIYVTHEPVRVVDGATNTVIATIPGTEGGRMAADLDNNRLYQALWPAQSIHVIDMASNVVIATILLDPSPLPFDHPVGVGFNPNTNRLYVSRFESATVVVLDAASFTNKLSQPVQSRNRDSLSASASQPCGFKNLQHARPGDSQVGGHPV